MPILKIIFEFKEQILYELCGGNIFNEILSLFIVGGVGPGGYYIPVMIQLVFIYPWIYFFVKKSDYLAVVGIFIICFIWEYLKYVYKMSDYEYRLLIIRYIPAISVGCYWAIGRTIPKRYTTIAAFCLGVN